jgi:hypothetical protein
MTGFTSGFPPSPRLPYQMYVKSPRDGAGVSQLTDGIMYTWLPPACVDKRTMPKNVIIQFISSLMHEDVRLLVNTIADCDNVIRAPAETHSINSISSGHLVSNTRSLLIVSCISSWNEIWNHRKIAVTDIHPSDSRPRQVDKFSSSYHRSFNRLEINYR